MAKYRCVESMVLEKVDEDGLILERNEQLTVAVGSLWEKEETSYRIVASAESTRLLNGKFGWIEIHDESLSRHFIRVQ